VGSWHDYLVCWQKASTRSKAKPTTRAKVWNVDKRSTRITKPKQRRSYESTARRRNASVTCGLVRCLGHGMKHRQKVDVQYQANPPKKYTPQNQWQPLNFWEAMDRGFKYSCRNSILWYIAPSRVSRDCPFLATQLGGMLRRCN